MKTAEKANREMNCHIYFMAVARNKLKSSDRDIRVGNPLSLKRDVEPTLSATARGSSDKGGVSGSQHQLKDWHPNCLRHRTTPLIAGWFAGRTCNTKNNW